MLTLPSPTLSSLFLSFLRIRPYTLYLLPTEPWHVSSNPLASRPFLPLGGLACPSVGYRLADAEYWPSGQRGWFPGRQRLPGPPQAREPLPSGVQLRVAHGGWLSDLEGQHKNPTRAAGVRWVGGKMAAATVSMTSGSHFSNILAESSRSNGGMLCHSSSS